MKFLLLAACVALASAWVPGQRDECNTVNINGGSLLLPHERYCQLYYTCDLEGNQTPLWCPGGLLFAYGVGIATCVGEGFSSYSCPKWQCASVTDIGRRYPDTCCNKYWECTAVNVFSPKLCDAGRKYNMDTEQCTLTSTCPDSGFCIDNIASNFNNECHNSPSSTGNPCMYRSAGWDADRQCPSVTAYDTSTCSCSQLNNGCSGNGLPAEVLLSNKNPDSQCRASGRINWANVAVFSDKLNRAIDHYFYKSPGFTSNSIEGIFDNSRNLVPFIYDYYYNDNTLYAPFAMVLTVRFDYNLVNLMQVYSLLENRWTTDPANSHCNPVTLRIAATYQGIEVGDRKWEFVIQARGENLVDSTGTATITGATGDYFRVVFTFGVKTSDGNIGLGGWVSNRGTSGQITQGDKVEFNTDNRHMGSALRPNKCGFAIGRGLSGRIREFSVHEGCSNFAVLDTDGIPI